MSLTFFLSFLRNLDEDDETTAESKKLRTDDLGMSQTTVSEVGTTTPVEDFEQLLGSGQDFISGKT